MRPHKFLEILFDKIATAQKQIFSIQEYFLNTEEDVILKLINNLLT